MYPLDELIILLIHNTNLLEFLILVNLFISVDFANRDITTRNSLTPLFSYQGRATVNR